MWFPDVRMVYAIKPDPPLLVDQALFFGGFSYPNHVTRMSKDINDITPPITTMNEKRK